MCSRHYRPHRVLCLSPFLARGECGGKGSNNRTGDGRRGAGKSERGKFWVDILRIQILAVSPTAHAEVLGQEYLGQAVVVGRAFVERSSWSQISQTLILAVEPPVIAKFLGRELLEQPEVVSKAILGDKLERRSCKHLVQAKTSRRGGVETFRNSKRNRAGRSDQRAIRDLSRSGASDDIMREGWSRKVLRALCRRAFESARPCISGR